MRDGSAGTNALASHTPYELCPWSSFAIGRGRALYLSENPGVEP